MSSTCIGYCPSAFMNTEVSANQSTCFSRITSFPPTVNPPLQMSCCHCATVLQSFLAVLWFWSCCPPPPFWCRPQFYNSLKAPYVLGAALLRSPAPSQRQLDSFWFLHLPETACIPELWALLPSSKSAVTGQVLFTLHLHDPVSVVTYPSGHTQERFST